MNKRFYFTLWFLLGSFTDVYSQQSAYYDAKILRDALADPAAGHTIILNEKITALLKKYVKKGMTVNTTYLDGNPFFKNKFAALAALGLPPGKGYDDVLTSVLNTDVTNFAIGLTDVIIERSKEDLSTAYFKKFKDLFNKYPELSKIFPNTSAVLENFYSYQYTAMLPALRQSFQRDMNSITVNLVELRDMNSTDCRAGDPACVARISKLTTFLNNTVEGRSVIAALLVADQLMKIRNPAEILQVVAADKACNANDNFSNLIKFSNLLSSSLRSNDQGRTWVTSQQILALINDEEWLELYLGLLYEQNQNFSMIEFTFAGGNRITLEQIFKKVYASGTVALEFRNTLSVFGQTAADVSSNLQGLAQIKDPNAGSTFLAMFGSYTSSFSSLVAQSMTMLGVEEPQLAGEVKVFNKVITPATSLPYDIKSQNYASLVQHTSALLQALLPNYEFKDDFIQYGAFLANLAEAKNPGDVKAAIDAAVLPAGSYSIKRMSDYNVALNAYLGPFAALEYLPVLKQHAWGGAIGITAPVGIAFSWGKRCIDKNSVDKESGGSSTLLLSLIDLGSVAAFRIGSDSSSVSPTVTLKDIFAFGLYYYYGFANSPIAVGVGIQVGPQFRDISATAVNAGNNYYVRAGATLTVDVPLMNFYNEP